jgi:hypothetical protein
MEIAHKLSGTDSVTIDCSRPARLFRYTQRTWAERALKLGEFRLRPAANYNDLLTDHARHDNELVRIRQANPASVHISLVETGQEIKQIGPVTFRTDINTNYLVLCFSTIWRPALFAEFSGADSCLVVHQPDEFCERFHVAVERILPHWSGSDGRVTYGCPSPLRAVFSKPSHFSSQQEWRFAWLPPRATPVLEPITVQVGNIEHICEIRWRDGAVMRPE